jgi:type I site-specific restriction endonuclease
MEPKTFMKSTFDTFDVFIDECHRDLLNYSEDTASLIKHMRKADQIVAATGTPLT